MFYYLANTDIARLQKLQVDVNKFRIRRKFNFDRKHGNTINILERSVWILYHESFLTEDRIFW